MKKLPKFIFQEPKEKPLSKFLMLVGKSVVRLKFKVNYVGTQNIPQSGGFILASNHIHSRDPIMISLACKRTVHFMAKSDLFVLPLMSKYMQRLNAFPIRRNTCDFDSLNYAQKIINKGWIMGIFPEGTRSKDLIPKKAKTGVAYICEKTKSDVLPVSIYQDPKEKGFRRKITVRFGEVIRYEQLQFGKEYSPKKSKQSACYIMNRIVELWNMGHGE